MVLEDTREMTEADADEILADIATLEIRVVEALAKYERKIALLKEAAEFAVAPLYVELNELGEELRKYVDGHRGAFAKPRTRQTAFGQYGLRAVSNVEVDDEAKALRFGIRNGKLGIVVTKRTLDKKAIRALIDAGTNVPGAHVMRGDETFYKVSKELLDKARQDTGA